MKVPTVGSVVKITIRDTIGPAMIPPRTDSIVYEGKVLPSYKWLTDREFCMSGDEEWPIRVIHMNLVEDINLISGNFKEVSTNDQTFIVDGSKGNKYTVTKMKTGWSCSCPGFQFRRQCKHVSDLSK